MQTSKGFEKELPKVNAQTFEDIAIKLFQFQATQNPVYKEYLRASGCQIEQVHRIGQIPFLPISFFKSHRIRTGNWDPEITFTSSGTTGPNTSRHDVPFKSLYLEHARRIFEYQFGPLSGYHLFALLPSYLEREGSSLISMVEFFIQNTDSELSGFYLNASNALLQNLEKAQASQKKVLLLGVTFALLDFAERNPQNLSGCLVMETGGMKGRRRELTRQEVHALLRQAFGISAVASEYGMTELLSQAYSMANGIFSCPNSMMVLCREINDPYTLAQTGQVGLIKVIDLANIYSCAFIETQDLGKVHQDGSFEIVGRADNSDARGCNLLVN